MQNLSHQRALIVGNADIPLPASVDPSLYDYVAVFNHCRKPELFPVVTHHFMRLGKDAKFAGDPEWRQHSGRVCIVGGNCESGRRISSEARELGRNVKEISPADMRPKGYPAAKTPSTGVVAIEWFRQFGISVDLVCHTWEGLPCHDWAFEKRRAFDMHCLGFARIVFDKEEQRPFVGRRLAHFFWLDSNPSIRDFDIKMFAAVHSFVAHHPGWTTTLWTNCEFSGPLVGFCRSIGLETMPIHRIDNQANISAEVDYWKWRTILDHGGMAMDISDTITMGNFDSIHDRADRLVWSYYSTECWQMGNGWLCINRPGADIAASVIGQMTSAGHCNDIGQWEKASLEASKQCQDVERRPISPKIVFGGDFSHHWKMIQANKLDLAPQCRQLHLYYGNVLSDAMHDKKKALLESYYSDLTQWRSRSNIVTEAYAISMDRAGVSEVPPLDQPKGA